MLRRFFEGTNTSADSLPIQSVEGQPYVNFGCPFGQSNTFWEQMKLQIIWKLKNLSKTFHETFLKAILCVVQVTKKKNFENL